MPKFQKISLEGQKLTFNVTTDEGHSEQCVYMLENETEKELMTRVAVHMQKENKVIDPVLVEVPAEPVMEVSVSAAGEITVKEMVKDFIPEPLKPENMPPLVSADMPPLAPLK